jgi:acyl-homoserine-lactone acylase
MFYRRLCTAVIILVFSTWSYAKENQGVELLWDTWGIPHIYAKTDSQLMYGLAWAQMHNHGNKILELYGESSGKAAELGGRDYLKSDRALWTMRIPQMAEAQYAALSSEEQIQIAAFAHGINDYAKQNPDLLDETFLPLLPLDGLDIVRRMTTTLSSHYLGGNFFTGGLEQLIQQYTQADDQTAKVTNLTQVNPAILGLASNAWVIGPGKSNSNSPLLLSNTHLPWPTLPDMEHFLWHEAHLVGDDIDVYGVGLLAMPAITIGFNDKKAWTITDTALDVFDIYELELDAEGYIFDGTRVPFDERQVRLRIKESDGSFSEENLLTRRSVHGPVIYANEKKALAIKYVMSDRIAGPELWEIARADTVEEFNKALSTQNLMPLNVLYADSSGNTFYTISGTVPDRSSIEYDSRTILPGTRSANLWQGALPFSQKVHVKNPASNVLQNTNEPPWTISYPQPLAPINYPNDWPQPKVSLRTLSSLRLLNSREIFSLDTLISDKFSTYSILAERVLDDLIQASSKANDDPLLAEAVDLLSAWDRNFDAKNTEAVLFAFWAMEIQPEIMNSTPIPESFYAIPTDPSQPLVTPSGIADPAAAAIALQKAATTVKHVFGQLAVPWGEFSRLRQDGYDLSASGAPASFGMFSINYAIPQDDGVLTTIQGDTWVFAVDFDRPNEAKALLTYSNATQPSSTHKSDQLELFANKQLRPVWRTLEDIENNLEKREILKYPNEKPKSP